MLAFIALILSAMLVAKPQFQDPWESFVHSGASFWWAWGPGDSRGALCSGVKGGFGMDLGRFHALYLGTCVGTFPDNNLKTSVKS